MRHFTPALQKLVFVVLLLGLATIGKGQTPPQKLKLTDFAVWGGSASSASYNSSQGVFIGNAVAIEGNVGSNHRVDAKNLFSIKGNVYSGNVISLGNIGKITGNIFAAKTASNYSGNVISGDYKLAFIGNLTANGKIFLKSLAAPNATSVTGQVAVPAPTSSNYSGPVPTMGIVNALTFPVLPSMPANTAFDNQVAASNNTTNITNTRTIAPGVYRKLALTGNQILTFNGPGNYIFYEVDNGSNSNKLVFNFNNTLAGAINIYIIKDAKWGRLSVSTVNGNFPSRIYTEIHGTGSANNGNTFSITGPVTIPTGSNVWLGNVWAPNGGISVMSLNPFNAPHIIGALWSSKKVELDQNLKLVYQAPAAGPNFNTIAPYFPPPASGKVATANNVIGAELFSLSQNKDSIAAIQKNEIFVFDNTNNVLIEVISKIANDTSLRSALITQGMTNEKGLPGSIDNGPDIFTITGFFPVNKLTQLNSNIKIDFVRPLFPPISNAGLVTSQGDLTMRSNSVRSRFGVDGTGVKIGVISDSYDSKQQAQTDVDEGDLPGIKSSGQPNDNPTPVQVIQDLAGQRGNDEGRAMLQIVHDVAPKAKLAFSTGFLSSGQFAKAIQKLASDTLTGGRCDIIVDDLTYISEPFQRDGIVARAVDSAVAHGVTYFSAAGNFGSRSYEAVFNGVTNTTAIPTGQVHKFGPNAADIYQNINLKPGSYTIVLQWSDLAKSLGDPTGAKTDMDLYIIGANGFTLFGFNRSNLLGDPFEICPFTVREETNAKLMIVRAKDTLNANPTVRFKYIIFRGEATILDYASGTSTVVGHPNADSAIAVGAMLYANIPPFTPVWPGVASFSSRGGTFTQTNINNSFTQRNKPDIIGPNGGNTTVDLGGAQFNDGDTYPNFFGTSAAAPHVAGVAALLIQARKKYSLQTLVRPAQVRQQLLSSAGRFSYLPGSFTYEGGYGYVQADSAVQQIANAKPVMSTLEAVVPGAQSGPDSFQVKITGKYLTPGAKIYVNGLPITGTTVTIEAATGIGTAIARVARIPTQTDPPFQLFNPSKSVSNLDGGLSEALHFFSSGTRVKVKADNKSRKYGQENPTLTASVTIINGLDTLDISQTSLTLAGLKLDHLIMATNAAPFSSPRSFGISVARTDTLPANDSLLTKYTFEFEPGTLRVEKMPLRIKPDSKVIKYGDDLSGITYTYSFDTAGVVSPHLLEEVKSIHKKYLADNGLIVINGVGTQNPALSVADLDNMSALASFQSVLNARKFIVENGQLKALSDNISLSQIGDQRFIVDVAGQSLQNYKLDPSKSTMVNALANAHGRGFLNLKSLTTGNDSAAVPNGQLRPMVNGQLLAMVNGQLRALVNGQLRALVNNILVDAVDVTFQNGQLLALINNVWTSVPSAQMLVTVDGLQDTVDLSISNGQLRALVNGQEMTLVDGQLQAVVNGQLLAIVNGQLRAYVNGQLTPLVNGQLTAIVNGSLQLVLDGQIVAIVNGQLMALINGELEIVQDLILSNDTLQAVVNGQLRALVNGQLRAMVNGVITDVPINSFQLVNGQLRALVNGQVVAYVNGQLLALVNGQLRALVNGAGVVADSIVQFANGQLRALVNGTYVPLANGQLQALVNGQLLSMVNGQLMAVVNGELTFVVFQNGQLRALVNGQLEPFVNGQLRAMVNGQLQPVDGPPIVNSQGELEVRVNGETWVFPNGQLKALVNGQLLPLVNNFDVSGTNNNSKTVVLIDEDDINLQFGDVGGMVSMNMITGLEAGSQTLVPGAFLNENFDVTYGLGVVTITKKPLNVYADNKTKNQGEVNPPLTVSYSRFAFDDTEASLCLPLVVPTLPKSIDQLERRTTYSDVKINGTSNVYVAQPGEVLTLTGNWTEDHFQNIIQGYPTYCPGCITQNYIGMSNDNFTGNQFDTCYDVSSVFAHAGTISNTIVAPSRPGVYYITQQSSWYFFCYQFGHLFHDQIANDAIAVVLVNPSSGISANTTVTDTSSAGNYPIIVGGCYFNPNYRIVFQDGTLTVNPGITSLPRAREQPKISETNKGQSKLYPNPASTILRLQLDKDVQTIKDIQIYDGTGGLSETSGRKVAEGVYEINVSQLPRGVYLITAKTTGGTKTFKFIKM